MNSPNESFYRLKLATGYLTDAEKDTKEKRWDKCLGSAQEAIENAGKSILAHFRPAPHTHEVDEPLENLLQNKNVPEEIKRKIREGLDDFRDMGMDVHIRATYGDEEAQIPPWDLIAEAEGMGGLGKARRAVNLAQSIYDEMSKE
ncbi:MAG: HEPN domain-containing protein [Chloroflexi bacterium]|nr:HEPN domain-containing protein [Chloroflexota bacterium]MBI5082553.1 HEPN domain-containing protein [Chloroflexota bacterium]